MILAYKNYVLTNRLFTIDILLLFSVSHRMKVVLTPGLSQELKISSKHIFKNHVSQLLSVPDKGFLITPPKLYVSRPR